MFFRIFLLSYEAMAIVGIDNCNRKFQLMLSHKMIDAWMRWVRIQDAMGGMDADMMGNATR